jgi:two-component system phosphate regulon sensor histidine kinase PhoR
MITLLHTVEVLTIGAVLVAAAWFYFKIYRPIRRVGELTRDLASGKSSTGYVAQGSWGLGKIIQDLESIDADLGTLRSRARSEDYGLKAILASMAEGVIITDTDRVIRMANGAFSRMFKVTGDPVGRRAFDVILHADVHILMDRALQGDAETTGEITIQQTVGMDAARSVFQLNVSPLRTDEGVGRGLVLVFHDITRIKQLEDVRREFVANVSHELRTPLAIFHGYLETLITQPEIPQEELLRVLQVLKRHSNRLNALVDDLLTIARIESGRIQLERVTLQVRPFLERIIEDWKPMGEKKECRLVLELPENPGLIEADPLRLEQVFSNLLDNALKYSEAGKAVVLGMDAPVGETEVSFFVRDAGVGIPADKVGQIFQRFYRVDRARSRDMGGTGLGLAIVKHIVQLHGGQVSAQSELGKGTTIRFTLPVSPYREADDTSLTDLPASAVL